ncbi:MAG TPA: hypothetical protein VLI05_05315 [Candidatus Saccharimonadia bacterium]|nr:hypothetical protein [Candidatus Saccharimonadia bacterium]
MENPVNPTIYATFRGFVGGNGVVGMISILIGVFFAAAAKPASGTSASSLMWLGVFFVLLGLGLLLQALTFRMTFTGNEIILRQITSRRMSYDDIERIEWSTSRWGSHNSWERVAAYVLVGRSGKQLKIVSRAYKDKHDWARLLLAIANGRNVQIDPRVRQQLEKASEEGYKQTPY